MSKPLAVFTKDSNAVLDYSEDWSDWLEGDRITGITVTAQAGITVDSTTFGSTLVTAWLSGGTAGTTYTVAYRITTAGGRTDERTINFVVTSR